MLENANPSAQQQRLLVCLGTLYFFAKVRPNLVKNFVEVLFPFLTYTLTVSTPPPGQSVASNQQIDQTVVHYVVKIIELALPYAPRAHLSDTVVNRLEDTLAKLSMRSGPLVLYPFTSLFPIIYKGPAYCWKKIYVCITPKIFISISLQFPSRFCKVVLVVWPSAFEFHRIFQSFGRMSTDFTKWFRISIRSIVSEESFQLQIVPPFSVHYILLDYLHNISISMNYLNVWSNGDLSTQQVSTSLSNPAK